MARGRYPFWTHDTVAAAVLAGIGMASLQSKLDGLATDLNIPLFTALVHGWPMLALFGSLVLLIVYSVGQAEISEDQSEDKTRNGAALAGSIRTEWSEAVGGGLQPIEGFAEIEEPGWCAEMEFR